jgi:hypothetical protein
MQMNGVTGRKTKQVVPDVSLILETLEDVTLLDEPPSDLTKVE